ncbi:aminoglycoside 6-adenylyltransferase [Leptospira kanakyensis]|uniref:aminoglycoside 6-adenylyltransferase n=1 Tax=Leptospira kanakyensis TaxID=2484968 RepID=UPI00223E2D63|nr:aminoglycoside 6-adenylyltransferase [Leptospira kanakyensis]MCW7471015.1 aminoglycoside 6-adenylyltransferase [Leptospira kanakyensis]
MNQFDNFLNHLVNTIQGDPQVLAVCVAGSFIQNELDEYSDLDIVLVVEENSFQTFEEMNQLANSLGNLLSSFTGEHVGEKKLLICLFDSPLLHVDLKFVSLADFHFRVENPVIIYDKSNLIPDVYKNSLPQWPKFDFQWVEDRFWVWIHYAATKIGRGELFEAIDFLSFLRTSVIGPMFHIKYDQNPRGVRKLELILSSQELNDLKKTYPSFEKHSIIKAFQDVSNMYVYLRNLLIRDLKLRNETKERSLDFLFSLSKEIIIE